eukprot:2992393-Amphidinium_carterae.2
MSFAKPASPQICRPSTCTFDCLVRRVCIVLTSDICAATGIKKPWSRAHEHNTVRVSKQDNPAKNNIGVGGGSCGCD